jgi:hypothetical protein
MMAKRARAAKQKQTDKSRTGITPKIELRASCDLRTRIERWAARQADTPSLSEALSRLVQAGLAVSQSDGQHNQTDAAKASRMAGQEIERIVDKSAPPEERAKRKRRLIQGPTEFRGIRKD